MTGAETGRKRDADLRNKARHAIVLALSDDIRGFDILRDYISDTDDAGLVRLYKASEALGDAVMDLQNERDA